MCSSSSVPCGVSALRVCDWAQVEAHRRGYLKTIRLQRPINFTSLSEWESDLPNLSKRDSGSSYCLGIFLTEGSVLQTAATALIRPRTSVIRGRRARSFCQQSSRSFQTLSERPISRAFAGFNGFPPSKTLNITSDVDSLPNGSVPVSTYIRGIGKCVCWPLYDTHLVDYHPHRVYVGCLRGRAPVQSEHGWDKDFWWHERSGPPKFMGARRRRPT